MLLCWFSGFSGFSRFSLLTTSSATSTTTALVAAALALVPVTFSLAVLIGAGEVRHGQSLREIDLCADRIGQVADHQDVLDMIVEVVLDLSGVNLGSQGERAHQVLAQRVVGLLVLVEDPVDPFAHAVEQIERLLDGAAEALDVGDERRGAGLGVLRAGNSLKSAAL